MKYIALTIGPIFKTLSMARKTRELWAGSYLFSYIMKNIIESLKDDVEFILPYVGSDIFTEGNEVGLFHDRFIFREKESCKLDSYKTLENILDYELKDLARAMSKLFKKNGEKIEESELEEYLKNYFQIYFLEVELDKKNFKEGENEILILNNYLDNLELNGKLISKEPKNNYIAKFMNYSNRKNEIKSDAFYSKGRWESIPEIALSELELIQKDRKKYNNIFQNYDSENERDIYQEVKNSFDIELKSYHKYIAIVQADGDNLGEVISNLDGKFTDFSKKLFDFAISSRDLIKDYKGVPIYAGGDDLLFFAPVVNGDRNIFNLLDDISNRYSELFKDDKSDNKKTSLSFGVSISYYKFPLYEALQEAINLLFNEAKSDKKDAIAFKVLKHSGQYFDALLHKNSSSYEKFKELLTTSIKDTNTLNALHYKLESQKFLLKNIVIDETKLENFFVNNFNEDIHIDNRFLKQVREYMNIIFQEHSFFEDGFKLLFSSLRVVKFLKGEEI